MKLNANDHTSILDILPENVHISPKTTLNRNSPKNVMTIISTNDISPTTIITGLRSDKKLVLLLYFSDIRCSKTLVNAVATSPIGIESSICARLKKPAESEEKNLLIKMGGNMKPHVLMNAGIRLNFGKSLYLLKTYFSFVKLIYLIVSPFLMD